MGECRRGMKRSRRCTDAKPERTAGRAKCIAWVGPQGLATKGPAPGAAVRPDGTVSAPDERTHVRMHRGLLPGSTTIAHTEPTTSGKARRDTIQMLQCSSREVPNIYTKKDGLRAGKTKRNDHTYTHRCYTQARAGLRTRTSRASLTPAARRVKCDFFASVGEGQEAASPRLRSGRQAAASAVLLHDVREAPRPGVSAPQLQKPWRARATRPSDLSDINERQRRYRMHSYNSKPVPPQRKAKSTAELPKATSSTLTTH